MPIPSNRKPPKDHKLVQTYVCTVSETDGMSVDDVAEMLKNSSGDIIQPLIEYDDGWGDYGAMTFYVTGFVELSAEEKKAAAEQRQKRRKQKAATKEKQINEEKAQLKKLLKKYPDIINE